MPVRLLAGDYRLDLDPDRGGAIASFTWRGTPLFRTSCGPGIFDTACFPLVPFSNRIAGGRFVHRDMAVTLAPNFPGSDHPHPLHGFGWLVRWAVIEEKPHRAVIRHDYAGGEWPWPYSAEQTVTLSEHGLEHRLTLRNIGQTAMPAGMGFHPYFPRTERTRFVGLHRGEWRVSADGIPTRLVERAAAEDWWAGAPVGTRAVDTVYTGRKGTLSVTWPESGTTLDIQPSDNLPLTAVYSPAGADFFCIEPVSHATNAINRPNSHGAMATLAAGERMTAEVLYSARWT